jgi:hypothetical protein
MLKLNNQHYNLRKYKILELINSLPSDRAKELKKSMPIILDVHRQTFAFWLNASKSDSLEIPSIKLALIAKILNVPIQDLINIKIELPNNPTFPGSIDESFIHKLGLVS